MPRFQRVFDGCGITRPSPNWLNYGTDRQLGTGSQASASGTRAELRASASGLITAFPPPWRTPAIAGIPSGAGRNHIKGLPATSADHQYDAKAGLPPSPLRTTGKPAKKRADLCLCHIPRMALFMEYDKPLYPAHVRMLGTDTVVPRSDRVTHLIKKRGVFPVTGHNTNPFMGCMLIQYKKNRQGATV